MHYLKLSCRPLLSAVLITIGVFAALSSPVLAVDPNFNQAGNILIADQFNNRVIEIETNGNIVWNFGLGPTDTSAQSILGVNDAQRVGPFTLMAGTGIPEGVDPAVPAGAADNRVILVTPGGDILWQYGQFGVTGSGPNELSAPVQCTWLPFALVMITDQGNQRVIIVDLMKHILWQYGMTGVSGNGPNQLNNPNSAELLRNGHILISDEGNNRAIEVDLFKNIVASFTAGGTASGVAFASRLPNGNTLLTDSNNNRIVEVDSSDTIVWQYATNTQVGSNLNPLPTRAVRLQTGQTLISDQFNHRVILLDTSTKTIVQQYGTLNVSGYDTASAKTKLNAPYDAKVIGDFTGLTPPFLRAFLAGP